MNYFNEMLQIWWGSLMQTMRDQSMRFPIALVIGATLGVLCWLLAAYSARLWNKKFYLKVGLQILCAIVALLTVIYTMTFVSSDSIKLAVQGRLTNFESEAKADSVWQHEAFCYAYDEVARLGTEPKVKKSPSPRTDPTIHLLPMSAPGTKMVVARSHGYSALKYFREKCPYLNSILDPPGDIPEKDLEADLVEWFTKNPGVSYPLDRGTTVLLKILKHEAEKQMEPVINYTKRLSAALFIITQLLVFLLISFLAYRSIRPTR